MLKKAGKSLDPRGISHKILGMMSEKSQKVGDSSRRENSSILRHIVNLDYEVLVIG